MEKFLKLRFILIIISVVCGLNFIFYVGIGVYKAFHGYYLLYKSINTGVWEYPGIPIVESLDSFLIGLVMMIFAFGIYRIFILHDQPHSKFPSWLRIDSLSELKLLLWEAVMVALLIFSVSSAIKLEGAYSWDILVMPVFILVLAISYFLVKRSERKKEDQH